MTRLPVAIPLQREPPAHPTSFHHAAFVQEEAAEPKPKAIVQSYSMFFAVTWGMESSVLQEYQCTCLCCAFCTLCCHYSVQCYDQTSYARVVCSPAV